MEENKKVRIGRILVVGIAVHLILIYAVFDIHFRSPIIANVTVIENDLNPPADRLVLFIGDGIRADSFFSMKNNGSTSPFLRSIIEEKGIWALSNTHVPTESRPGHVAILAGMYEDPSAIFKGWQNYIVDFDSVLNKSEASFSWGSPDILNIFSKGSTKDNAYYYSYPAELQQFSGTKNSDVVLTYWVLNQFELFMSKLSSNDKMAEVFQSKKTIYFFHFLGTDVAGHASKPHSKEYIDNIKAVDECVSKIYNILESYFNDGRTAYIFTSDHGMTDWGSHGGGTDAETLTPLVMWGAGIKKPISTYDDDFIDIDAVRHIRSEQIDIPEDWDLSEFRRFDVNQVDIAPLMSILIGIPIPVNSVGIIPVSFLDKSPVWILKALLLNIKQLKSQFDVLHDSIKSKLIEFFYVEFPEPNLNDFIPYENKTYDNVDFSNSVNACLSYDMGIHYYRNYFNVSLLCVNTLMFLGWIFFLLNEIVYMSKIGPLLFSFNFQHFYHVDQIDDEVNSFMSVLSFGAFYLLSAQSMPYRYYVYSFVGIGLWWHVIPYLNAIYQGLEHLDFNIKTIYYYVCFFLFALELLVITFKKREIISTAVMTLSFFWCLEQNRRPEITRSCMMWLSVSFVISFFAYLPTVGNRNDFSCLVESLILWIISSTFILYRSDIMRTKTTKFQFLMIIMSFLNAFVVDVSFAYKQGLFLFCQILSWFILGASLIMTKFGPKELNLKYIHIAHSLCSPFLLLSTGHEAVFLNMLFLHLYSWILLEFTGLKIRLRNSFSFSRLRPNYLKLCDFRIALFFLTYVLLAFFGIGNIASLNSFDPSWTRGFVTMFSPFTMMSLIILKTAIPIFLVTCAFRAVISFSLVSSELIFYIVFMFCDVIGLQLFLMVTHQGSWLEIGTSLTQFIIMEGLTAILLLFYGISLLIMPDKKWSCLRYIENLLGFGYDMF